MEYYNDQNQRSKLKMPAMEISYFEGYQYEFMLKHMAEMVYHARGQKKNHDLDLDSIRKEITGGGT